LAILDGGSSPQMGLFPSVSESRLVAYNKRLDKQQARQSIEKLFHQRIDRDVSGLAADYRLEQNLEEGAKLCLGSHKIISERLWSKFSL
jgi:hypothetical protein